MHSLERLLQELTDFLPDPWQYPEVAQARVLFQGKTYVSKELNITNWRQAAQIYMYHEAVGEVAIFYLEECPPSDEGPFLKEERALLDAVAEQIGTIATRMYAENELQETNRLLVLERKALQEANTALRIVLSRIEQEKQETYRDVNTNVEKVLKPIFSGACPSSCLRHKEATSLPCSKPTLRRLLPRLSAGFPLLPGHDTDRDFHL